MEKQGFTQAPTRGAGFTLIELLIVVAIIGILAAITVPNFLNAQIRAKIARAVSDIDAIATAQQMYRLDKGRFTPCADIATGTIFPDRWQRLVGLTTPVSYIAVLPQDVFPDVSKPLASSTEDGSAPAWIINPCYVYNDGYTFRETGGWPGTSKLTPYYKPVFMGKYNAWLCTRGPSGKSHLWGIGDDPYSTSYDATNGLISVGVIQLFVK